MGKQNFFVDGGTVQAQEGAVYLRREADEQLLNLCREGTFAYVLTARQMGKSSLMVNTSERLTEEGIRTAEIDLTSIGVKVTEEQWYLGILFELRAQLGLRQDVISWWLAPERQELGTIQRLLLFFEQVVLDEVRAPVVVFVDEIETTLRQDFTDDFFAAVRSIHNARSARRFERLSFVLIGAATPDSLISDPQLTPFNIGRGVLLSDFTLEEALPLAEGFRLPQDEARRVLRRVLHWSGGHPYLTQRLCRSIAESGRGVRSEREVDEMVAQVFFGDKIDEDKNLRFVREMLLTSELNREELLATYKDILSERRTALDEERSLVKSHLKLSGVVKREGAALRVRNPIYRKVFDAAWVRNNTPVNWSRRLTRAAAAVLVTLMVLSIPLAAYAWTQKVKAEKALRAQTDLMRELRETNDELARANKEARDQSELAQQRAVKAQSAKEEAEAQRARALKESEKARASALAAEEAKRQAEEAKRQAEAAREAAQLTAQNEASARGTAELATQKAKLETRKSNILTMVLKEVSLAGEGDKSLTERALFAKGAYLLAVKAEAEQGGAAGDDPLSLHAYQNLMESVAPLLPWRTLPLDGREIDRLCFTEDGQQLVGHGNDSPTIQVWDFKTQRASLKMTAGAGKIIGYRPGGRYVGLQGPDGSVIIREVEGTRQFTVPAPAAVTSEDSQTAYFSPTGDYVMVSHYFRKRPDEYGLWRTADGRKVAGIENTGRTLTSWYSHDGAFLITADRDGGLRVIETQTGQPVFKREMGQKSDEAGRSSELPAAGSDTDDTKDSAFETADISQNGRFMVISTPKVVEAWDMSDPRSPKRLGERMFGIGRVERVSRGLSISNDGRLVTMFAESERVLDVWDVKAKSLLRSINIIDAPRWTYMTPDASRLITFSNYAIRVWDVQTGEELHRAVDDKGMKHQCVDPNGNTLATVNEEGDVRLWEVKNDENSTRRTVNLTGIRSSYRRNDMLFRAVFKSDSKRLDVLDMVTGKQVATKEFEQPLESAAFSPNGEHIVALVSDGKEHAVWLWAWREGESGARRQTTLRAEEPVQVSLSPDGEYLSVLTNENSNSSVRVWATGAASGVTGGPWKLTLSKASFARVLGPERHLLVINNEGIQVWDFMRGRPVGGMFGRNPDGKRPGGYAYNPDGTYVAAYSFTGKQLEVVETATGAVVAQLPHSDGVHDFDISRDGNLVVTVGEKDGFMRVWDRKRATPLVQLKNDSDFVTFSDDGRYVVTMSEGNPVRVWDISRPGEVREVARIMPGSGARAAYLGHDNKYLYTFKGTSLQVWRWNAGELVCEAEALLTKKELTAEDWGKNFLSPDELHFLKRNPVKCGEASLRSSAP